MSKEFTNIELLDDWFRGALTETQKEEMQQRLASDDEFKAEFEVFSEMVAGVKTTGDLNLRQAIAKAHEESRRQGFLFLEDDMADYHEGKLNDDKASLLERRMQSDEAFAKAMEQRREMLEGIRTQGDLELKAQIKKMHAHAKAGGVLEEKTTSRVVAFRQRVLRWSAVAAVALLAIAGAWWYFTPGKYDEAFAAHYQANPDMLENYMDVLESPGFALGKGEALKMYRAGMQAYENGDYAEAEKRIAAWLEQNPSDENAQLFLGLSYMAQQEYKKAARQLEPILKSQNPTVARETKYYLALAWCKMNFKRDAARKLLEEIAVDDASPYQQQALAMLQLFQ